MDNEIKAFIDNLLALDRLAVERMISNQGKGRKSIDYIENIVVKALEEIGKEWLKGNVALAQVYMAGKLCEQAVDLVLPAEAPDRKGQPKMAICTLNDHHNLGKSIVYSLLRASGFELQDLGCLESKAVVEAIETLEISYILISVLMLPSALKVAEVRQEIDKKGIKVKILVGGAPFRLDRELWKEVGADAMCADASSAPAMIDEMMRRGL